MEKRKSVRGILKDFALKMYSPYARKGIQSKFIKATFYNETKIKFFIQTGILKVIHKIRLLTNRREVGGRELIKHQFITLRKLTLGAIHKLRRQDFEDF